MKKTIAAAIAIISVAVIAACVALMNGCNPEKWLPWPV